ncbi:unnamed protein product [Dovyalis caffra]|uniref:Uncharacterized protein n=1 Tax=Dovyalis caffra TaxID=77055 RepID=A0AAV1R110_9ROSI|nr:unnamed protein product [Dovyalis caffra]
MEDDINILNGIAREGNGEILNEECVKGTPPDAEIFNYRLPENGGSKVELLLKETGLASQELSFESAPKREFEKEIGNNPATN